MSPPPPPPAKPTVPVPPPVIDLRTAARDSEPSRVVYRPADFEHSVHLDDQNQIVAGNGKLEEFASLAAYACRIGDLIGKQLGIGAVVGIETTLENGVFLIHRDHQGDVVGIKPSAQLNLVQLKAQLNL